MDDGKKITIERAGSYDVLQEVSMPIPDCSLGEVVVKVRAAGVNFADCCVRMGIYASAKEYVGWPITPGFEVAGEILVSKSDKWKVGDRVIACTRFGGYASHIALPDSYVFSLPESLTFAEGATIPAVFLTAWFALCELAHPRKGQKILVHSAAGGVGSALVQIGKILGCEVTGVVGASHKVPFLQNLGVDAIIDKSKEPLWQENRKYDVILDANGVETLMESYRHLAPGGKLVVYGFHSMLSKGRGKPNWMKMGIDYFRTPRFNPLYMTSDNHSVLAFNLSFLFDRIDLFREAMEDIFSWLKEGKITLPEVRTLPFSEVSTAHKMLESGQTTGKIALLI